MMDGGTVSRCRAAGLALMAAASLSGCGITRNAIYSPHAKAPPAHWIGAAPAPISVHTADGLDLAGYYWPGAPGDPDVYVYFHGRNWTAERSADAAQHLLGAGNAVLVASYRGFGHNPGKPGEAGLLRDAAAFIARARDLTGPDARIWLIGHSIGAAVVLHAGAADGHVSGVIAMSAFVRIADATPRLTRALLPDPWDNGAALATLDAPVLFIEGGRDGIIPAGSSGALFSRASHPASLVMGETSHHNPDMAVLAPWINRAIAAMQSGSLSALPAPPSGWIEKVRRP